MFTHKVDRSWGTGQNRIERIVSVTGGAENNLSEAIAGSATNAPVAFAADISQVKELWMSCDKAVTVKTNSSGSPVNTFSLAANVPFSWIVGDPPMRDSSGTAVTTDITSLFLTNADAGEAAFELRCLIDPTV